MHKFYLNIFFVFSLVYGFETINISLDPISHNTFYLNSVHPVYQSDFFNKEYVVEGNLGSAMSVYYLEDLYANTNDSIRTVSSFLYKQGDVGYRDFTFTIKTKVSNAGILKLAGNGLTYPGRSAQYGNSNILQNYLLSFSKQINSSKAISFYMLYHLENTDTQHINSNSGESYLLGIDYDVFKENYEFHVKYASQTGQANFSNLINHHIRWGMINFNYKMTDKIVFHIDNKYKDFYLDGNKYSTNNLEIGFLTNFSFTNFNSSLSLVDSDLYPKISLESKFNHFNIGIGLNHDNWFDCSEHSTNNYQYYFSNISYKSSATSSIFP